MTIDQYQHFSSPYLIFYPDATDERNAELIWQKIIRNIHNPRTLVGKLGKDANNTQLKCVELISIKGLSQISP